MKFSDVGGVTWLICRFGQTLPGAFNHSLKCRQIVSEKSEAPGCLRQHKSSRVENKGACKRSRRRCCAVKPPPNQNKMFWGFFFLVLWRRMEIWKLLWSERGQLVALPLGDEWGGRWAGRHRVAGHRGQDHDKSKQSTWCLTGETVFPTTKYTIIQTSVSGRYWENSGLLSTRQTCAKLCWKVS